MRFGIYSRKSKEAKVGDSIGNQIEMCTNFIKANYPDEEHTFTVFEDEGFSGKNTKRPGFRDLMQCVNERQFDFVVVYRLDRISRNIVDFATIIEQLQKKNTGFISINERFDTSSPMGRAMMQIAAVFAQLERETIAERVRDNMLMLSYTGHWLGGKTPLGFDCERIVPDAVNGAKKPYSRLVPSKDYALIDLYFSKYEELGSLHSVNIYLYQQGYTQIGKGQRASDMQLKGVLSNPVYCIADQDAYDWFESRGCHLGERETWDGTHGIMPYNRHKGNQLNDETEWILAVGDHQGAISGARFVAVQQRMKLQKEKHTFLNSATNDYSLVSGLLYCAKCGKRMYTRPQNKKNRGGSADSYLYFCPTRQSFTAEACDCKGIVGYRIDEAVLDELRKCHMPGGAIYEQLQALRPKAQKEKGDSVALVKLKADLDKAKSQWKGLGLSYSMSVSEHGIENEQTQMFKSLMDDVYKEVERLTEQIATMEDAVNADDNSAKVYNAILQMSAELVDGSFTKQPIPVQRDFLRKVLAKAEWDGEKVSLFLRGA